MNDFEVMDHIMARLRAAKAKLAAGDIGSAPSVADLADLAVHAARFFGTVQEAADAALIGAAARQAWADSVADFAAKRAAIRDAVRAAE